MLRARVGRLLAEWRPPPAPREVEEAIRATRVEEMSEGGMAVVTLGRGVYASVPTREGRVRLLAMARRAAREAVVVHVVVTDDDSHVGRVVIDVPRRALRRLGLPLAEPGDRFGPERYAHCFFDEEALLSEIAAAGLRVKARHGYSFVLDDAPPTRAQASSHASAPHEKPQPFRSELSRVARSVRAIERTRLREAPERALAAMRERGSREPTRGPVGRARLRRAVGWVDALFPGGGNCYRRILLEVALDAGAARETVVFGLDVGTTGHVAFEDREERTFDVSFAIPADR